MPARRFATLLPIAAAAWLCASAGAGLAFSQIGSGDGSATQKEGIVSVPLPPLEGAADAVPPAGEGQGATGEGDPAPSAAPPPATAAPTKEQGTTPAASPATASPVPAASPAPATPAAAEPDPGSTDEGETELPVEPDAADGAQSQGSPAPAAAASEPVPPAEIFYGDEGLPRPVRDLREKLIAIARSGEIENLRPYIEGGEDGTTLSFAGMEGDPIAYLKSASGDGEGVEILAILLEILQAGHVRNEAATDNEIFVWPYFTGVPIDALTKPQKVELFELVTAGDYQEMLGFGAYNFYRAGISPEGRLEFFVAGD